MLLSERRVVITGLGVLCPIGIGPDAYRSALEKGQGGLDRVKAFPVGDVPTDIGGEVPPFDLKNFGVPRKIFKYLARDIRLAVAAAHMALKDAGLVETGQVDPTRIGLDLGAGLISTELDELAEGINVSFGPTDEFDFAVYGREGVEKIEPTWLLKYLPNMLACHISILNDCQGPSNTITEAEAASNVALGEAARIVARNRADVMISGGADSKIHPLSLIRMSLLGQMSHWRGDPALACRPFDRGRDGWVPGEGAGILILEDRDHALARGIKIHGEFLGFGSGCDAQPSGGLDPEGIGVEIALRAALRDARLEPKEIGHVNAHGAATIAADSAEAKAIARVFGPKGVPVVALKGYMGNLVSGCGAVELIGSLLGVQRGWIPPTIHCDDPDPACELDLVRDIPRPTDNPIFINVNFTRSGQAAAVVIRGEKGSN